MTSQIPDVVVLDGRTYSLTAVEGHGLFDPADHGLEPQFISTACWRGFLCTYAVVEGRLVLDTLDIGLAERPPRMGPGRMDRRGHGNSWRLRRLSMPMPFTGR